MIFASDKGLQVAFRGQTKTFFPNGEVKEVRPRLRAKFERGGIPDWALPMALERLEFKGIPMNMLPEQRLFVWDSVLAQKQGKWTDTERQALEDFLLRRLNEGETTDYIVIERDKHQPPWPGYVKLIETPELDQEALADAIVARLQDLEIDPEKVLAYERENARRPLVIEAVELYQADLEAQTEIIVGT